MELCVNCGQQALGHALDGRPFCDRRECIDWKLERWKLASGYPREVAR